MEFIASSLTNFLPHVYTAITCTPAKDLFGIVPVWYKYLKIQPDVLGQCAPVFSFPNDIFAIGLAIVDMLLRVAGFVAVISIIVAGIQYIISLGNQEKGTLARKRIQNALIGLAIVFVATAFVSFIGRRFG